MKETIHAFDHADHILGALKKGILLNTLGEKFNSMVIGWGHMGILWGRPTFLVYVRENRYTKHVLDETRAFTISVPEDRLPKEICRVCGSLSGWNVDKAREAGMTLAEARTNGVPGVKEAPLTLECRVLYSQRQILEEIPEDLRLRNYPQEVDGSHPMANRDPHTLYVGEIVDAYLLKD